MALPTTLGISVEEVVSCYHSLIINFQVCVHVPDVIILILLCLLEGNSYLEMAFAMAPAVHVCKDTALIFVDKLHVGQQLQP